MVYCIRSDSTGIQILPFVYFVMLVGNIGFIFLVVYPAVRSYRRKKDDDISVPFPWAMVIEFILYEIFSCFMVWSHCMTMLVEPGFVPRNYKYVDEKLPVIVKVALNKTMEVEIENQGRPHH